MGEANFDEFVLETAPLLRPELGRSPRPAEGSAAAPDANAPIRQAGPAVPAGSGEAYYHIVASLDEERMRSAYLLADIVISRAGATTIYEIAAWGKPAILVPIKISAQDHQRENAYEYGRAGAAMVIEEDNLTPTVLAHEIRALMADAERRAKMSEAAKAFARPDAAELIAREVITVGLH